MAHLRLTQDSKLVYYRLRAEAALRYPDAELFMVIDGGTGDEYTLPHQSAFGGPMSKALRKTAPHFKATPPANRRGRRASGYPGTVKAPFFLTSASGAVLGVHIHIQIGALWRLAAPVRARTGAGSLVGLEVTNAFCHGDRWGHVLLTPGLLSATADLTCEVVARLVNTHAARHKALPPVLRVQLDGASTNKNHLCLALLAQYVQAGLFDHAILQFLVEHHAHESPPSAPPSAGNRP